MVEYIIAKYGKGRLALPSDHSDFAPFLYWYHFANGTLQAQMGRNMILNRLNLADENPVLQATRARVDRSFDLVNARLGEAKYLAAISSSSAIASGTACIVRARRCARRAPCLARRLALAARTPRAERVHVSSSAIPGSPFSIARR